MLVFDFNFTSLNQSKIPHSTFEQATCFNTVKISYFQSINKYAIYKNDKNKEDFHSKQQEEVKAIKKSIS